MWIWLPINDLDDTLVKCITQCEEGLIHDATEILETFTKEKLVAKILEVARCPFYI